MPGQRTILLIDYDPKSIEDTTSQLRRAGYRVEVAGDGQAGLEVFAKLAPDLVLIEPMVPKKHGFQVCHEIKSTPRGKTTPVLITTAFYRGRKHRTEAQERYGCDGYLEKPISEELLLSTCRSFLIDMPGPPLPAEEPEPRVRSADAPPVARGSVISFPELPLVEEREPARLVALDDLSDEEIQDRLDHMILEESADSSGADRAAVAPPLPAAAAPVAANLPGPPIARGAEAGSPEEARVEPTEAPRPRRAAEAPARAIDPVLRRHDRPARERRQVDRSHVTEEPGARSRLPMWIGVAAVACVLVGAGLLWSLRERSGPPSESAVLLEPLAPRRMGADADRSAASPQDSPAPDPTTEVPAGAPADGGSGVAADVAASSPPPTGPQPDHGSALPGAAPPPSPSAASRAERPAPAGSARAAETRPAPSETLRSAPAAPAPPPAKTSRAAAEPVGSPAPESQAAVEAVPPVAAPDSTPPSGADTETDATPSAGPRVNRGDLVPLGEVDVAPRPLDKPTPEYPRAAAQLRQEGTVMLRVLVGEDGRVERAEVDSGAKHRTLQTEALRAVERWTYEPATKDGVPVKVWITEAVTFKL